MKFDFYVIFNIFLSAFLAYEILVRLLYINSKYYKMTGMKRRHLKKNKSAYFEYLCFKKLLKIKGDFYVLMNAYLPKSNGKHTECDIILIHNSGVYSLEIKSINGEIYGDDEVKYWTACYGKKDFSFYNPIKQNQTHIRYISKNIILDFEGLYKSIIVFNDNAILKNTATTDENTHIIIKKNIKKTVNKIAKKNKNILNKYMMKELYERLLPYCKASYKIKKAHRKDIKKITRKYG